MESGLFGTVVAPGLGSVPGPINVNIALIEWSHPSTELQESVTWGTLGYKGLISQVVQLFGLLSI